MGQEDAPSSCTMVKFGFLRKLDAEPKKRIRSCSAIALTSVTSTAYATFVYYVWKRNKNPKNGNSYTWEELTVSVVNISK